MGLTVVKHVVWILPTLKNNENVFKILSSKKKLLSFQDGFLFEAKVAIKVDLHSEGNVAWKKWIQFFPLQFSKFSI